jgi:phosphatidylserine/phosphatidylglycerophosphate/cardiolipin synthase-like enzyme
MIKYLTTQGVNYHLENLLKNASSIIILISPYIQLQRRIRELLQEKKQNGVKIYATCRKKDLKEDINRYVTSISDVPTLHAKCYMNENEAIITSLNLYEFSQQNNEEMGIYVKNEDRESATENPPHCILI